ncbi:MAG: aminotransferase class V-fold PLP-dependent enzyme [Chloroflexi bacterium]|nr:aminotransferase class V-fold PLP-dependent enzyme [Chloroflexota bacterium]
MLSIPETIREQLPAVQNQIYLNTGTCGPQPRSSLDAMRAALECDVAEGRISAASSNRHHQLREGLRALLAEIVGAPQESVCLTHNTGEGINIILAGMRWREGDEVITTDSEHISLTAPLANLQQRFGIRVTAVASSEIERVPALIAKHLTERTRLVAISHVSWMTGAVFPVDEIVAVAHRQDVPVLVDAAQSAGAMRLHLGQSGADYCAMAGQKWFCGPEGMGALYIRPSLWRLLENSWAGYMSGRMGDANEGFVPHDAAKRFEVGAQNAADFAGLQESLRWQRDEIGLDWIAERTYTVAEQMRLLLKEIVALRVITTEQHAGLVVFSQDRWSPQELTARLADRRIIIRSIPKTPYCRVSTGFYTSDGDLEETARAIAELTKH